ncbi:hypothetical protein AGOR_G00063740 [Albula goreensis]|uniref:G-protein coupled receptors family 1 profile domain-containing protein n=1 Tax=Albula goreensis TaxID=1534307 RepID=A0A8T3DY81_9TELE|nr:hypothetical protein AGOR_G00063740 [Albula goreensis]
MENTSVSLEDMACSPGNASCLCRSQATILALPILYSLMFLIGLPGNALSLWIFTEKIDTKTSTHIYLINLSVCNLLLCMTMPVLAAYFSMGHTWHSHQVACQLAVGGVTPVLHANIYVAILILTWIALSRVATLIQQSHSGRPSTCTRILPSVFFRKFREVHFARAMCMGIWVGVLASVVPVMAFYFVIETEGVENVRQACYSVAVEVGGNISQMTSMVAIALFFLCFLLVLASYMSVTRHICRAQQSTTLSDRNSVYRKVYRNIAVIQLVLAICLLPHHIFKPIFIVLVHYWGSSQPAAAGCHQLSLLVEVKNGLLCLAASRSAVDPIMYFLVDNTFHLHVTNLLRLSSSKKNSQTSGSKEEPEHTTTKATKL